MTLIDLGPVHPLTATDAAYAAGVHPRTMRGWTDSGHIALLVPRRGSGAWLRLPPADVMRLAIVGHLLRFGFSLAECGKILAEHVDRHLSSVVLAAGDVPWAALRMQLLGLVLTISREPLGIVVSGENLLGGRRGNHAAPDTFRLSIDQILYETQKRARERGAADA